MRHILHALTALLLLPALWLGGAFPAFAENAPAADDGALWKPTLAIFMKMAEESNARLEDQRARIEAVIARYRADFALVENLRQQVILCQITADDPWDFRDALRGIRQLRDEVAAMSRAPETARTRVENALSRLQTLEADILAQDKRLDANEEFLAELAKFRQKIDALRNNAQDLDKELVQALSPATLLLKSLDKEEEGLRVKTSDLWKSYYASRHPSLFEMNSQDNILRQADDWRIMMSFIRDGVSQPGFMNRLIWPLAGGAAIGLAAFALSVLTVFKLVKKGYAPRGSSLLLRCGLLLSLTVWIGYAAEKAPFQYYTLFSVASEIFFAAALTALAIYADRRTSGEPYAAPGALAGKSVLWLLWRLFLFGFIIQLIGFPYFIAEALYAAALAWSGLVFWRRARTIPEDRRFDLALTKMLGAAFFGLFVLTLAGYPQLAILLTSALFYLTLSVRFSLAIFRFLSGLGQKKTHGPPVLLAVFSGLGFPLIFLTLLLLFLWLISIQFGGENVFFEYISREFRYESFAISLGRLCVIIVGYYLTRMLAALSSILIEDMRSRAPAMDKGAAASLTAIARYFWWGFYILCVLFFLGFSPTSLAVVAGGLSVGIGFGLQNIVNNFISGLILLFGRSIQAGDVIEAGGVLGVVKEVNIRNTEVLSFDNATLFTPNSDLISNQIVNWSHADPTVRRDIDVGVAYGSDLALTRSLLIQAALESPFVLRDPRPNALFWNFGASSLDFKLRLWVDSIMNAAQTLSDVRDAIDRLFREHGVEIPFPQADVRVTQAAPAPRDEPAGPAVPQDGETPQGAHLPDEALP